MGLGEMTPEPCDSRAGCGRTWSGKVCWKLSQEMTSARAPIDAIEGTRTALDKSGPTADTPMLSNMNLENMYPVMYPSYSLFHLREEL